MSWLNAFEKAGAQRTGGIDETRGLFCPERSKRNAARLLWRGFLVCHFVEWDLLRIIAI